MTYREDETRMGSELLASILEGGSILLQDGAMGTMLQAKGLAVDGTLPDILNLTHPDEISAIHKAYVDAGAQMVTTNTFGANRLKLGDAASVGEVYAAAAENARRSGAQLVAGDIGPTGALLEPLGSLSFEDAVEIFSEQARAAADAGCDLIAIETQTDLREAKAAVIAAKECTELPIFVTMTFGEDGRTFLGTPPEVAAVTFSALGVQAIGINCSLGPDALGPLVSRMLPYLRCPLIVRPNAGMPKSIGGETAYDLTPKEYASRMIELIGMGATIVGGCCGTTPEHIRALHELLRFKHPDPCALQNSAASDFSLASSTSVVSFSPEGHDIAVIGENINPTRRKSLKEALISGDVDAVLGEALRQQEAGADIIDVNVGVPGIDEPETMRKVAEELQASISAPIQIDSSDPKAIEAAARVYGGKPLINSVNGKRESLSTVLPIAKRYGCAVLGLTLDEAGIPPTAEGRLDIAKRIVEEAEAAGIDKCDVAIDCLVMTAATNQSEVAEIFRSMMLVKSQLGVATVLGVSNVSFGLPDRALLNSTFLAAAVGAGLNMPIINPCLDAYRDAVLALKVLNGQDVGSKQFIARCPETSDRPLDDGPSEGDLADLILSGRTKAVAKETERLLADVDGLSLIAEVLVPSLDEMGKRYESGLAFLPQLIASAEAAQAGFKVIREHAQQDASSISEAEATDDASSPSAHRGPIVMATVQGDIHDIGKNIVAMLLENYGFEVIDLGFDVSPEAILKSVRDSGARMVGLSALMTTTVTAMEETIRLLHERMPNVKVSVGGAVLTPEYAKSIGADFYSKDAAEAVHVAQRFFDSLD